MERKERELFLEKKRILKQENALFREQRKIKKDQKKAEKKERQRARKTSIVPQMGIEHLPNPYSEDFDISEEKVEFDASQSAHLTDEYLLSFGQGGRI